MPQHLKMKSSWLEGSEERFWSKAKRTPSGCLVWQAFKDAGGYGRFRLGGKYGPVFHAHRVAWALKNGAIPKGKLILHHCDNRACIEPMHLFMGTQKDNMRDCVAKGRFATGDRNGRRIYLRRLGK